MAAPEWMAEARKRCTAATPAPWTEEREQDGTDEGWEDSDHATGKVWGPPAPPPLGGGEHYDADDYVVLTCHEGRDAEFVAAARTDLPRALDALHRVQAVADAYEEYAATCDRDAATWPQNSPTGGHWRREAAQARMVAKRIRDAIAA